MGTLLVPHGIPLLTYHTSSLLIGPPVGGVLYNRFGFRAPFILGILITALDLIGRVLIIEPTHSQDRGIRGRRSMNITDQDDMQLGVPKAAAHLPAQDHSPPSLQCTAVEANRDIEVNSQTSPSRPSLSLIGAVWKLLRSPRAIATLMSTLVYG